MVVTPPPVHGVGAGRSKEAVVARISQDPFRRGKPWVEQVEVLAAALGVLSRPAPEGVPSLPCPNGVTAFTARKLVGTRAAAQLICTRAPAIWSGPFPPVRARISTNSSEPPPPAI
jgi:hypothetical protein